VEGRVNGVDLPLSRTVVPRLLWRDETASTNDDLRECVVLANGANWPHGAAIATLAQRAGHGRLGRSWDAPRGASLAVSVLVRPSAYAGGSSVETLSWLSLVAGLAMTETVRDELARAGADPARAALKWPNDVLVDGSHGRSPKERKISGILCEIVVMGDGTPVVVIGAGLNIGFGQAAAPTPTATSFAMEGVSPEGSPSAEVVDHLLAAYLTRLVALVSRFFDAEGDARASGILDSVSSVCGTISRRVRVELAGDEEVVGTAIGLDAVGRLLVRADPVHNVLAVAAGDVTHLRY